MLEKIVTSKVFQYCIISIIILNGITMWLETSEVFASEYAGFFQIFNLFVLSVFVGEAILKISFYKKEYFKSGWNMFDFLIIMVSLLPTSWPFQILRILRVFRLLRLVTIIPSMRKIVVALFSIIPGILSVWGLLMIIFYVYAILSTQLFGSSYPEWFGSLGSSLYTLFQIMTLESWSMWIVRPVMEQFPYAWILFISFILIATFVMINLVIAIVVEAMNKITRDDESKNTENITKANIYALEEKIDALYTLVAQNTK